MNTKRLSEHLEKILTFKSVADLKSIQKASYRLGVSQPAVTRTIKVLEDVLECRLTERESRGIKLTAEGMHLYEYAKILFRTLEDFAHMDASAASQPSTLRIATYDNIVCQNISRIIEKLILSFPHVSIATESSNLKILGDLSAGKYDCAFIAEPRVLPGIKYKKIFTERYGIFLTPELYKKSGFRRSQVTTEEIENFCFITMPDAIAGADKKIDRLLWESGLKSSLAIDSYEVALQLTLESVGIGILPLSTAWRELKQKKLIELNLKGRVQSSWGQHNLTLCWNSKNEYPGIKLIENELSDLFDMMIK